MTMRVMKAFQIQVNYQKHKSKLSQINGFNTKKKVSNSTYKNMQLINNYKKSKITSEIFKTKQKASQLITRNRHIQRSLDRVYKREPTIVPVPTQTLNDRKRLSSHSSVRSLNSESRIRQQNLKIIGKISTAKSQYSKFRQTSHSNRSKSQRYKQQLIKILENQLGAKSKVVFPKVKPMRKESYLDIRKNQVSQPNLQRRLTSNGNSKVLKTKK